MKKLQIITSLALLILLQSCSKEEVLKESNIDTSTPELNSTDVWLRDNYTTPYNIDVLYKWDISRVDFNRYLYPPTIDKVVPVMEAIKTIWLDTYNQVVGSDFVKRIAPREILLIGGINLNPSGTITLGLAEAGKRITFFNTDLVDLKDKDELTRFVATIQHEYCHIINQAVPFDEEAFEKITPSGYTAQWFNHPFLRETNFSDMCAANDTGTSVIAASRSLGFISDYARSNEIEDFAEMVTAMLSNSNAEWNQLIDKIAAYDRDGNGRLICNALGQLSVNLGATSKAKADIRKKEQIVVNYFKAEFGIDIYELQRVASENILKVLN